MAPPKTVLDKIVHAVTKMADPTGSSRVAIVKFLKREFDLDNANAIKKALKQGVDKGSLVQKGQSFTIPGVEFQEPEDMKVSITEVTIGDGDVATKGSTVTMRYRGTLDSDGSEFDAGKIDFTLPAGEVYRQPVISLDLFATAAAIAQAPLKRQIDGVNLVPYLTGKQTGAPHTSLYWRIANKAAYRKGDWKLLRNPRRDQSDAWELYNLSLIHI